MSLLSRPLGMATAVKQVYQASFERWAGCLDKEFTVDASWKDIIGQWGIEEVAKKLAMALKFQVRIHLRGNVFIMEPVAEPFDPNAKGASNNRGGPGSKVPRPPNAFILYRQHNHEAIKAAYPDRRNVHLSQIIAANWKAESPKVREHYKNLALRLKQEHALMFPDYTYQPRKSGDKKRRMTAKKAARVQAFANAIAPGSDGTDNTFETTPARPILVPVPFGEFHTALEFTLGNSEISPRLLHSEILDSNQQFNDTAFPLLQNVAPILAASPAPALSGDIDEYERLPAWEGYDSRHALGGMYDEEYSTLLSLLEGEEPTGPSHSSTIEKAAEMRRQLLLDSMMLSDHLDWV